MAVKYGVESETIRLWTVRRRREAKEYAKKPEMMAAVFGLDLLTLIDLPEEERESVVLGEAGETAVLKKNGLIRTSD